ncbi:MAG TPA: putative porin, partial [Segetibacter sp.]
KARQEGTLFNVLHLSAKKRFKLSRHLNLYSEVHLQQTTGNPPVNLPLFFTSNRLSFEGFYYKNMLYAIGVEVRYHTPYKADDYSPFLGQFFYQNNYTISNRPEVNAFFNFRIKTFKAFIRAENINTIGTNTGSPGFNKNNLSARHYPQQGFWFRLGIWWTFIN